jgi:hypothetical protein
MKGRRDGKLWQGEEKTRTDMVSNLMSSTRMPFFSSSEESVESAIVLHLWFVRPERPRLSALYYTCPESSFSGRISSSPAKKRERIRQNDYRQNDKP